MRCGADVGGAISAYNVTGLVALTSDTFKNNSAGMQGGVVAVTSSPTAAMTFSNATLVDNTVRP